MGDWGDILGELTASAAQNNGVAKFDDIRRKYLVAAAKHTGRSTILYASKFTQQHSGPNISPFVAIEDGDLQGIMTAIHQLPGPNLDLILHSPGGSPQAAEAIVSYLRSRFSHIRVIVPHLAMSAATMIACAADVVVMGEHSFLGPIDPQIPIRDGGGVSMVPAEAILDQFELAKKQCADPKLMGAWLPMLPRYGPALLVRCQHAMDLGKLLVEGWLQKYMFKRRSQRKRLAKDIADWLGEHRDWKTHSRHIPRHELKNRGFRIENLERDGKAQDLFLSVFHAVTHTFTGTDAVKIIENNRGKAFINRVATVRVVPPGQMPQAKPSGKAPKAKKATARKATAKPAKKAKPSKKAKKSKKARAKAKKSG